MTRRALHLTLALFILTGPVLAQVPQVTPAGDPSVKNDTIYRLAVNPASHPNDDYIYLFNDGILQIEPNGRNIRTYRQVIQILSTKGAEHWGELTFHYSSGSDRLNVNWARVVDLNGHTISDQPAHQQESVAPVAREAPIYSDSRIRQLTLSGVAPGVIVDYSYTVERLQSAMPGEFYYRSLVTMEELTRRSRLVLEFPMALRPRIKERNLSMVRRTAESGGRRMYTWAAVDVPKYEPEPFAADSNGSVGWVAIGAPVDWTDIARWYASVVRDRYGVTPTLDSALAGLLVGASTLDDSLKALHRWVAQDFRYVSISLGMGGYQPRLPAAVLETKYGDCKDKATLFIALARRMGLTAYPVLLGIRGHVERDQPSVEVFDHMIAALVRPSKYLYVDPTAALTPFGALPPSEQGEFALVVHPDGRGEQVVLPVSPSEENRLVGEIEGELTTDGLARGHYSETARGSFSYPVRDFLARSYSPSERELFGRIAAGQMYQGAIPDSVEMSDGRDLGSDARVNVIFHDGRAASPSSQGDILTLPFHESTASDLLAQLETSRPRRLPIDLEKIIGPGERVSHLRLTLPEGWRAKLPPNASITSQFGNYDASYSQEGRVLTVTHRISGTRGIEPPERVTAVVGWLREVAERDVHYIVLQH